MFKRISDKKRIDFLQSQSFTKWVGYDTTSKVSVMGGPLETVKGHTVWPVFGQSNLRKAIDLAINSAEDK